MSFIRCVKKYGLLEGERIMKLDQQFRENSILIEVSQFENYGGWVLDTQFIPNMGSSYLLAHGLGKPVSDATTTIDCPNAGEYRVWVYTKNWVESWTTSAAPGIFKVYIDEQQTLTQTFGTNNPDWHWQDGGCIHLEKGVHEVSLHDLTGFEGRCGGILLTQDYTFMPPVNLDDLIAFRRFMHWNEDDIFAGQYDLIVAGGGIAGICAALSGARNGLKTVIIQDRPVIGGNNSSEVRVWLGGETNFDPFPNVGNIVKELEQENKAHYGSANQPGLYEDDKKLALLQRESNLTILLEHAVINAEVKDQQIQHICVYDIKNNLYKRMEGSLYVDATGDGVLGYTAGADYEVTTNGHMGMTNFWYIEDTKVPQSFPRCKWAIDLSHSPFPGRKSVTSTYNQLGENAFGGWYWESGCEHEPIKMAEYARDTNFRAMYGAWDTVKNVDGDYETYQLGFSAYIAGKRESRRFLGDIVLTKSEVFKGQTFDDGCVPSTWSLDVHYPDRKFYAAFHEGDGFLTKDYHESYNTPYFIPYRCFYSRNINNLFMAGRNVSVSHDALGTVRVMRTCGMMGEVVGVAAMLCKKYQCTPRSVYEKHLDELIRILQS